MGQTSVQFFATRQEIMSLVDRLRADSDVVIAASHFSDPGDQILLLPGEPISWIGNCTSFHLKLGPKFSEENSLFIHIRQDDTCFRESFAGIKGEGAEFEHWKKQLARFRRTLQKGAYVMNPKLGGGAYYKNVYYTDGAKAAFDRGVRMMASVGWNHYLLGQSQP